MGLKNFSNVGRLLLILIGFSWAQEDSLRSALNAIDRRQKDLDFSRFDDESLGEYGYSLEGPDDLAFLSPSDYITDREYDKNPAIERLVLDYLDDSYLDSGRDTHDDDIKKRISSSFRERLEEDKERQLEELLENYLATVEIERNGNDDSDYSELIRELWEKYRNNPNLYNHPRVYFNNEVRRRPSSGNGLRKRNKYYDSDVYNYNSKEDFYNKYQDDSDRDESNYYWTKGKHRKGDHKYDSRPRSYNYPIKRFPVSKRSSNYEPPQTSEIIHEHKRSTTKKDSVGKTDPQVAKDLSNIFGTVSTEKPTPVKSEKPKVSKKEQAKNRKEKSKSDKSEKTKTSTTKEEISDLINDKPLQIQKKSINWSDYFGIDRRKKSEDELDNEWLMERYQKAIALTTKRNAEYPLQSFKNHDQPRKKESEESLETHKPKDKDTEDLKLSEMDAKLKNMEDTIIDDALKYTGAHEGTTDSQEIQEVKDRIISRLAAAYSLEKMRRALGEYKLSVAKERERLKQQHKSNEDYDISEEKRVSVPRKQAVDESREKIPEGDNNIKCTHGDEDCEEQNYRTPSEIVEQTVFEECPRVQRACGEFATILGHYARVFETACNMHQMCLLCGNNSWFAPTRQCNVLFLTKAFELCDGKQECQKEAQKSVKYLMDVNRSLRLEPLGECELACPDRR